MMKIALDYNSIEIKLFVWPRVTKEKRKSNLDNTLNKL